VELVGFEVVCNVDFLRGRAAALVLMKSRGTESLCSLAWAKSPEVCVGKTFF